MSITLALSLLVALFLFIRGADWLQHLLNAKRKKRENNKRMEERKEKLREFEISDEDREHFRKLSLVRRIELNKRFAEIGVMTYIQDHGCLHFPEYYRNPRPANVCYEALLKVHNRQSKLKITFQMSGDICVSVDLDETMCRDWNSVVSVIENVVSAR